MYQQLYNEPELIVQIVEEVSRIFCFCLTVTLSENDLLPHFTLPAQQILPCRAVPDLIINLPTLKEK